MAGQKKVCRKYYQELLKTFQDLKSSVFWDESLQGYWNEYQIRNYGKTRVDYNNNESDINEDDNEPVLTGRSILKNLTVRLTKVR